MGRVLALAFSYTEGYANRRLDRFLTHGHTAERCGRSGVRVREHGIRQPVVESVEVV
jgi:hypothetical protein